MIHTVTAELGGRTITIETGKMAKQAGGAVTVRSGDSIVLVTACVSSKPKDKADFLPLTVDYIEKTFAAGKIPGGFFQREGRPSEQATLTSRFIDRPIRPMFPEGYYYETQVIATVLSADTENEPDVLAMIGASAALMLSEAPFQGPIAGVRVCRIDGQLKCNPTLDETERSDIDLIVAGSRDAVVMVEGGADEAGEEAIIEAITFAHQSIQVLLDIQIELQKRVGRAKIQVPAMEIDEVLKSEVVSLVGQRLKQALRIPEKEKRSDAIKAIKAEVEAAAKLIVSVDPATVTSLELETSDGSKAQLVRGAGERGVQRAAQAVRPGGQDQGFVLELRQAQALGQLGGQGAGAAVGAHVQAARGGRAGRRARGALPRRSSPR